MVKYPPANAGDVRLTPGSRRYPWRRKWQPAPVFLPGKSHGQRSLEGYHPWSHKRAGHDLANKKQRCQYHAVLITVAPALVFFKCSADEKTTLKMGENVCKWSNWQRINLQNIQIAHTALLKTNKQKTTIKKWAEDLNRHLFKEDIEMAKQSKQRKGYSISLIIIKVQIKATISSHQSEWPASQNLQTINAGEGREKREPSCSDGGSINWYSRYREQYGGSLKN